MTKASPSPPSSRAIAARRRALRLTLRQTADRVKEAGAPCSTTTVWHWENGLIVPERHWTPLAKALRCSVAALRTPPG